MIPPGTGVQCNYFPCTKIARFIVRVWGNILRHSFIVGSGGPTDLLHCDCTWLQVGQVVSIILCCVVVGSCVLYMSLL